MRIGLLHGYELSGSGSNEYTRYLSRALARRGHEVHVLCREPRPESCPHVGRAFDPCGRELFARDADGACTLHVLPDGPVRPVFLTDKQRQGNVKAFVDLTDAELADYHARTVAAVRAVLAHHPVDVLHANHLVWQPCVAAEAGVPFVLYPHGSSIEYTVRRDARYRTHAGEALARAAGVITGSREVLRRLVDLYPDHALEAKSRIVGVGVDTSLFRPVPRDRRWATVTQLTDAGAGKTRAQVHELRARLDRGDWDAVLDYRDAYEHDAPDAGLPDRIARIPWQEGRVMLFVGALTAGKGLQSLIAALPRVLERVEDAHLVVVGSGAYREVLEALVHAIATGNRDLFAHLAAHGFDLDRSALNGGWDDVRERPPACPDLAHRVHFLGRLDHQRLRYVFPCTDLAVFPSVVPEAYPLVLMESLANGVLPVVSDFSGFRDGLDTLAPLLGKEFVDCMRLPVEPEGRVAGIVERLGSLLADPVLHNLGPGLRAIAVEHFDWSKRAAEMAAAYAELSAS